LFGETQTVTLDTTGNYKVQLGASNPNGLPANLFSSGEARWLDLQIAGQPPQPRVLLASVPYALKAAMAPAGIAPDLASNVTTTGGTAGYVPEFNGATTIVDSPIFVSGSNVGIGTTTPSVPFEVVGNTVFNGATTVNGNATYNGNFVLPAQGSATATTDSPSQVIKVNTAAYNSSTKAVVNPRFELQAFVSGNDTTNPGATLNLLASTTSAGAVATGFSINTSGIVTFAPGQTFPGVQLAPLLMLCDPSTWEQPQLGAEAAPLTHME
jgi:trimeric autotransporter adhesin